VNGYGHKMPKVIIRYKKMNDKDLESVAEAMASIIIDHIQNGKSSQSLDRTDYVYKERRKDESNAA